MSDPKDELGARFDERRADTEEDTDGASNQGNMNNTGDTSVSDDADNMSNPGDTGSKPGPDRDETATRHRRQVPMYLPDSKADELNELYERLDGQSKVAGEGGIEKHADFMEELVDFAIEHEDELAVRLGIEQD